MPSSAGRAPGVGALWLWQWWQGCTRAPGLPAPFESVQGRGWTLFVLLGLSSIPRHLRRLGHVSWGAWTRGKCQFLSLVGRAQCKTEAGWQRHGARLRLRARDFACVPPPTPFPLLPSVHTSPLPCLCVLQGGGRGAIPCAVLPAMCPRLIRGHQRPKISFLLVLGLHFLNHLALSFVSHDSRNSTWSVCQDRCFSSRGCLPLSRTAFK